MHCLRDRVYGTRYNKGLRIHLGVRGMCGMPSLGGVKLYGIWCRDGEVGKNHQGVRRMRVQQGHHRVRGMCGMPCLVYEM